MAGFYKLKSDVLTDQVATGEAIIRVSRSAFDNTGNSEWKKFNDDTRKWLWENGYRYEGPNQTADGKIPVNIEIVPVYDTENRMHVRVPWAGDLTPMPEVEDEPSYGNTKSARFKVVLARYFMRKCR